MADKADRMEPDAEVMAGEQHALMIEQALWEFWHDAVDEPLPPKILILLRELAQAEETPPPLRVQ
ncbi:hypothetical protein ABEG18_19265 [Alsobacter sp. KACC 23698]|uniref:Anti-sigma factor NepR domain-containing protein n=1 Tax=Alsobacter sp. KACC 23698 TaxID=3149229 RepID=A0AAU7JC87_9HYPH